MLRTDADLKAILDRLTLQEKVGQLLMIPPMEEFIRSLRPGSVIVGDGCFTDDIPSARRYVADLQKLHAEASGIPLWMHGFVAGRAWAGPRDREIAANYSLEQAEQLCFEFGKTWRDIGLHTYPSPTVNIPEFDTCIARPWAISDDPDTTVEYARAITRGLIRANCGNMAQHFPAHGATAVDSHVDVPVIDLDIEKLMRVHIPPYTASFEEGCTTICTAHLRCPALDPDENNIATTSKAILTDFLRGQLGFRGVTIADSIQMEGFKRMGDRLQMTIKAVAAGCDSICITEWDDIAERVFKALVGAARDGALTMARLDEAVLRNLAFKRWLDLI